MDGRKLDGVEHETPVELAVAVEAALAARVVDDLIGPAGAVLQLHCHAYDPEEGPRGTRRPYRPRTPDELSQPNFDAIPTRQAFEAYGPDHG